MAEEGSSYDSKNQCPPPPHQADPVTLTPARFDVLKAFIASEDGLDEMSKELEELHVMRSKELKELKELREMRSKELKELHEMRSKLPSVHRKKFNYKPPWMSLKRPIGALDDRLYVEECDPLDAWQLRERHPDHIPVSLEKDAWSLLPGLSTKIYRIQGDMLLGEFVDFIRSMIGYRGSIYVFFKKTKPPMGALMSAIDVENRDEDGFLRVTYCDSPNAAATSDKIPPMDQRRTGLSKPIVVLDRWNDRAFKNAKLVPHNARALKSFLEAYEPHHIDAWELRKTRPDHIPVSVDKDASSNVPELDMTKYLVPGDMALSEFVDHMRRVIWRTKDQEWMFVYFKNTLLARGASMFEVDEKNGDEDGFLHITYSDEDNGGVCGFYEDL